MRIPRIGDPQLQYQVVNVFYGALVSDSHLINPKDMKAYNYFAAFTGDFKRIRTFRGEGHLNIASSL